MTTKNARRLYLLILLLPMTVKKLQADVGDWQTGLEPGYSSLTDYYGHRAKNAFSLQAFGDYQLMDSLAAGLELGYSAHHYSGYQTAGEVKSELKLDADQTAAYYTSDTYLTILQATPQLKWSSSISYLGDNPQRFRWYINVGAGPYVVHQGDGTLTYTAGTHGGIPLPNTPIFSKTSTFLGANAGVGASSEVVPNIIVGLGVRYHDIYASVHDISYFQFSGDASVRF